MKRTSRRGFTLIELIVTIVILGILAALAVPAFQAVIERSRENAAEQAVNSAARELHALAAFDENFDAVADETPGAVADTDWQTVLDEAIAAEDLDAGYTLVADSDADTSVELQVTINGYTATAEMGTSVGSFDASDTTVVAA